MSTNEANNCSLRSLAAHLRAKLHISKPKSEPEQLEKSNRSNQEDHHGGAPAQLENSNRSNQEDRLGEAPALYKLIHQDLVSMKEYVDRVNVQINHAGDKLQELQTTAGSSSSGDTELEELKKLKKVVAQLRSQIPSRLKIPADSNQHRSNTWADINKSSNETMHFYQRPEFQDSINEPQNLQVALDRLPHTIQRCLFCFLIFPPSTIIKRRFLTYWWIANGLMWWHAKNNHIIGKSSEDIGNQIFDRLIAECFIKPVFQKHSLAPDSCMMSHSVHSAIVVAAKVYLRTFYVLGQDNQLLRPDRYLHVINVGEAIVDDGPELFEKMRNVKIAYLGRWQSLATHHIEVASTKTLYGLKNMNRMEFLSLRGISLITDLPSFISEFPRLKILDLKSCHNLEVIPDGIGLLKQLTHLDMSECYFLEYMPKSLANLSELEVLKGFLIQDSKYDKQSCTLDDLSGLQKLRKLNIYTGVEEFPTERHLSALRKFQALQKLTISWGGCSSQSENHTQKQTEDEITPTLATDDVNLGIKKHTKSKAKPTLEKRALTNQPSKSFATLPPNLQKLDLQCFRGTSPPSWLRPANLNQLNKLYIRGGQLRDLGQFQGLIDENQWTVKILYLKYLSELEMNWEELSKLFPNLVYLVHEKCPKLTNFPETTQVYLKPQVNKSK